MPRCADCGFLAVRGTDRILHEVERESRRTGRMGSNILASAPTCFVQAADLQKEMVDSGSVDNKAAAVINKDRVCPPAGLSIGFTPWIQGYTPKEHREMIDSREMRAWQAEQREKDRVWQDEQRTKDDQRQNEQRLKDAQREEDQRANDRQWQVGQKWSDRCWHLAMVSLAGLFGLIGVVVGYLLTRNSHPH
jgi:hypothetical protein